MEMESKEHTGVEMTSEDFRAGKYFVFPYSARFRYSWDTGEAVSRFLAELKNGKIIARKCKSCGRTLIPPRMFCERDFVPTDEWVYVKDTGTVKTYSISYLAADASRLREPIVVAVVDIDGASDGMGMLHILKGVSKDQIRIGMRVKAVWKPKAKRRGAITDIDHFEPLRRGEVR
jgi:uncharacterized OB-fold protein